MAPVETELILSPEDQGIFSGLSAKDQGVVNAKIQQAKRLVQILDPFSPVQQNLLIEAQHATLFGLRRAVADLRRTLHEDHNLQHTARTIFEAPEREEHDLSYKEAISQLVPNAT